MCLLSLAGNSISKTRQTKIRRGPSTTVLLKLTDQQTQLLPPKFYPAPTTRYGKTAAIFSPISRCISDRPSALAMPNSDTLSKYLFFQK